MGKQSWRTLVLLAGGQLLACVGWQPALVRQAAFDHRCSEDQVRVLRDSGNGASRTVDLNVCGRERRYRDLGGSKIFIWVDITDGMPALPRSPPSGTR